MKRLVRNVLMLVVAMVVSSCSKTAVDSGYLDVTPNNIAGVWRMEQYEGGNVFAEGSYYYIEFVRKDKTFVSYDNLNSMGVYKQTGRYDIEVNAAAIIWGHYDFKDADSDWSHRYYVRDLTADRMVWVAVDDATIVRVFVRDSLPAWIEADKE